MKHTPGEWTIKISADGEKFSVISDNGEWPLICLICGFDEPAKANARLIAASPEMLEELKLHCEACRDLMPNLTKSGDRCDTCTTKKLINKIEGEDGSMNNPDLIQAQELAQALKNHPEAVRAHSKD